MHKEGSLGEILPHNELGLQIHWSLPVNVAWQDPRMVVSADVWQKQHRPTLKKSNFTLGLRQFLRTSIPTPKLITKGNKEL